MGAGGEGPILQAGQVPDELYCLTQDVTYAHRVDHPGTHELGLDAQGAQCAVSAATC